MVEKSGRMYTSWFGDQELCAEPDETKIFVIEVGRLRFVYPSRDRLWASDAPQAIFFDGKILTDAETRAIDTASLLEGFSLKPAVQKVIWPQV